MALENKSLDYWSRMLNGLHPQIVEIGRTEAVHVAAPSIQDLRRWIASGYSDGNAPPHANEVCDDHWIYCKNIAREQPLQSLSRPHLVMVSFIVLVSGLFALLSPRVQEILRSAYHALKSSVPAEVRVARFWLRVVCTLAFAVLAAVVLVHEAWKRLSPKALASRSYGWRASVSGQASYCYSSVL
jgi:hypothetical protein